MKTIPSPIQKAGVLWLIFICLFTVQSCKKSTSDPNVLTGDTNIPLTQKDSVTNLYFVVNGTSYAGTTMKVLSNNNGMVTYGATVDLTAYPDSLVSQLATIVPQLINYYNPKNVTWNIDLATHTLNAQFEVKVTSDGMQNYFVDGNPWTVRYADPQGTNYSVTRANGQTLTATVTEKTDQDDWPYGFYYIKTSKVEYVAPVDDPVISKVTYRVNHKYGLVYIKVEGRNGKVLEMDLMAYFIQ